ncbi:hypothetical protein [Microbacterium sp. ZXX196]|uniref:hypothetical protein n=1 Tax=Microbacterium sp. ZXX196 TaxID=2609291 RepID=UPI0012BA1315|nr:hypothetical protein [Microbacterium sp. ZXX196]MTE24829.1 hypothetical protein [Microbacterium sp. ZXX196]
MPGVELASVDELVYGFLSARVPVPVRTVVPASRPASFVRAWRTGGTTLNRVLDEPIVTVQAWASTAAEAEEIARLCHFAFLNEYTAMPLVRGVETVAGPYSDPDPDSQSPRYSLSVRMRVRAG